MDGVSSGKVHKIQGRQSACGVGTQASRAVVRMVNKEQHHDKQGYLVQTTKQTISTSTPATESQAFDVNKVLTSSTSLRRVSSSSGPLI